MLVAVLIFGDLNLSNLATKGVGDCWSAMGGALLALLAAVSWATFPWCGTLFGVTTFAFIAIIIISLLQQAGFFEWIALHVAHMGRGSGSRLFVLIVLPGQ